MSRENIRRLFDSSKQYVVSTDSVLPSLDGSKLYNIRPAHEIIEFTDTGSDRVLWNMAGTAATVFHSLNCYPIVTIYDGNGLQIFPTITVLSSMSFRMDFEYDVSIDPESPWCCIINYGGEFGSSEGGGDIWPEPSGSSSSSSGDDGIPLFQKNITITITEYDSSEQQIRTYNLYKLSGTGTTADETERTSGSIRYWSQFYTSNCTSYANRGEIPDEIIYSSGTRAIEAIGEDPGNPHWLIFIPYEYFVGMSYGGSGIALVIDFRLGTQRIGYPADSTETYIASILGNEGTGSSTPNTGTPSLASYFDITIALNESGDDETPLYKMPLPIIGHADPTTSTKGVPGQTYYNDSSDKAFICLRLASGEQAGETLYIWKEIGSGGGGAWGEITGTLSNQTDLANALAGKQNTIDASHKLPYSYLSGTPDMADYVAKTEKGVANGVPQLDNNGKLFTTVFPVNPTYGTQIAGNVLATAKATNAEVDNRSYSYKPIVPNNLDYAVRSVLPNVTVIPAATTAYTLLDASATTNNHSCKYRHAPTSAPTYTLPDVTDDTVEHEITLDVDFSETTACVFEDEDGNIISLQDDIEINYGDKWRFMCSYAYGIWMVFPMKMNVGIITAAPNISITGTAGSELTLTALPVVSSDAETVTFGTATGLPSGVSVSEAGFVSGTPEAAGTYDCTVKAYAKYARPVDVQFQIVVS